MGHVNGKRPKLVLFPMKIVVPTRGATGDDFEIYASYRGASTSGYYGTLKVVRKPDGRLLYPLKARRKSARSKPKPTRFALRISTATKSFAATWKVRNYSGSTERSASVGP